MHEPITRSRVLLVEGKDEVNFFIALLKHMGIGDDVQVLEVGGKDKFPDELPAFLNDPGFPRVRVYAIVREAGLSRGNRGLCHPTGQDCRHLRAPWQQGTRHAGESLPRNGLGPSGHALR
jgi:hypothetical protein